MAKISEELVEWCNSVDVDGDACDVPRVLAERIEKELIELPKDMDRAPIHVGDTVYTTDGSKAYVERICIMANTTHVKCAFSDGRIIEFQPTELTHIPDSWNRIAEELDEQAGSLTADGYTWQEDAIHDFADRIRKLAKEQANE